MILARGIGLIQRATEVQNPDSSQRHWGSVSGSIDIARAVFGDSEIRRAQEGSLTQGGQ